MLQSAAAAVAEDMTVAVETVVEEKTLEWGTAAVETPSAGFEEKKLVSAMAAPARPAAKASAHAKARVAVKEKPHSWSC